MIEIVVTLLYPEMRKDADAVCENFQRLRIFEGVASQYTGLSVRPSACLPASSS